MPGTLLLEDYEQANQDELKRHLAELMAAAPTPSDSLTSPVIQAGTSAGGVSSGAAPAPAPMPLTAAPTPSDTLTSPVIQAPEPTPEPSQTRDELQAHLDGLMAPDTSTAPPATVSATPDPSTPTPTPMPVSETTPPVPEPTPTVSSTPPRPLQLLGEGLTSLNAGAQNVRQELQNHLTSLIAPQPTPDVSPSVAPTPSDSLTNPVGTGNAAPPDRSLGLQDYARTAAQRAGIDPDIFVRQIQQESGFNPSAKSPAGAIGVSQFMPATAAGLNLDPTDPYAALDAAAKMDAQNLQTYGGDWGKTLASYNAGPAAVAKYGGIPPFEETQRYVANILGEAKAAVQGAAQGAQQAVQQKVQDISQFGDSQLTASEAAAACGPAASVRFAQRFGRNPTLREATDLAASVGWTQGQGMAGIGSEKALLDKMGVATKLVSGPDWGTFADEARTGNPVIISTAGHYFTADNWDPTTNKFHVGRSGLDLKGGAEWMTPEQMTSLMGQVQGGLLADNPTTPTSTATRQGFSAPGASTDQQAASVDQPRPLQLLGEGFSALGSGAQNVASGVQKTAEGGLKIIDNAIQQVADTSGPQTAAMQPTPSDVLTNPLGTGNAPQPTAALTGQPAGGIAEPTGPAVLPSIGEAKDALLQGDTQGALDALGRAGTAASTSAPGQAIAENQANPPLAGLREQIANAPVLGGALGMARGPMLLSDEEVLRTPEADTTRTILEQSNARAVARGQTPTVLTDTEVAEATRALLTSHAIAMTGQGRGFGHEPLPSAAAPEPGATQILGPRGEVLSTVPAAPEAPGIRVSETSVPATVPEPSAGAPPRPPLDVTPTVVGGSADDALRAGNILLPKYVQGPVRDLIAETYRADPARFDAARRGTVSNEEVQALAEAAGTTVDKVASAWKPGKTANAETTLALRTALADRALRVRTAQNLLKQNPGSLDARNTLIEALTQHAALQEVVSGTTAEAGRTLAQFRQPVTGEQASLAAVQRLAKNANMAPEELAAHLANVDLSDPTAVASLAKTLTTHPFASKAQAIWYFNLLSSPVTWTKNAISNSLVLASRPVESLTAAGVDLARAGLTGTARERFMGEAPAEVFGATRGLGDALGAAYRTMRTGLTPRELANPELAGRTEPFRGRLADLTLNVPGRVLAATDSLFRTLNEHASLYKLAYRQAAKEGTSATGMADRIAEILRTPDQAFTKQADAEAAYRIFQNQNPVGQAAMKVREALPFGSGRFVLPFINTPVNVGAYALERSPLAAAKLMGSAAERTGGQLSDNVARMTLGSALAGYAAMQGYQGNITGAAPDNPTERDAWEREGKQPYSIHAPDGTWYSYAALQPFSTLLAAGAAAGDAWKKGQDDPTTGLNPASLIAITGVAAGRAMIDQPWLQGLAGLVDMLTSTGQPGSTPTDPMKQVSVNAQRALASGVVPAGVRLLARAFDPTSRTSDPGFEGFGQAIAAGIPGLTEKAPARLGAFGQSIQRPGGSGPSVLNPFNPSPETNDPVEKELRRLQDGGYDVEPSLAGKRVTLIGEAIGLTPDQQRQYQTLSGVMTHDLLTSLMATDAYRSLPGDKQALVINRLGDRVADAARKTLYPSLLDQAVEKKIAQETARQQRTAPGLAPEEWVTRQGTGSAEAPSGAAPTGSANVTVQAAA